MKKAVSGIVFILLLASMLTLTFNIRTVKGDWVGIVTIRADGSVDPPTAPIATINNVTYTLTDNINGSVIVERSNIIIDGNKCMVQGFRIYEASVNNVTIQNANIEGSEFGILFDSSSNNTVLGNNITAASEYGIYCQRSSGNFIYGNRITNSASGIRLQKSSNNTLRYNIMTNNTYNFGVFGIDFSHFMNDIDVSNTVDGKPIRYWINMHNAQVPLNAGYVALINCTDITIKNMYLTKNWEGILIAYTNGSSVMSNNITNNEYGIQMYRSFNNSILGNNVTRNSVDIYAQSMSSNNTLSNNIAGWVRLESHSDNNTLLDNTFSLVYLDSSYNLFMNNDILSSYDVVLGSIKVGSPAIHNYIAYNNLMSGPGSIELYHTSNNYVVGNVIAHKRAAGGDGIKILDVSSNNVILHNTIIDCRYGIELVGSSLSDPAQNNTIAGNSIIDNFHSIHTAYSFKNKIYHNNFINNERGPSVSTFTSLDIWDDGYPSGGNYWSDYNGTDLHWSSDQNETGSDGIGDVVYEIDADNRDRYPLMAPFNTFDAGVWNGVAYNVDVVSNSTLSNFQLNTTLKTISFNVTGVENTAGFCRITIPNIIVQDLWQGNYTVLLNGESWSFRNWTDNTNTYIYVNYTHSEHQIIIIPEFPSAIILPLFMILSVIVLVLAKKKRLKKTQT